MNPCFCSKRETKAVSVCVTFPAPRQLCAFVWWAFILWIRHGGPWRSEAGLQGLGVQCWRMQTGAATVENNTGAPQNTEAEPLCGPAAPLPGI